MGIEIQILRFKDATAKYRNYRYRIQTENQNKYFNSLNSVYKFILTVLQTKQEQEIRKYLESGFDISPKVRALYPSTYESVRQENPTSQPKKEVVKNEISIQKRIETLNFTLSLSTSETEKKDLKKRIDTLKFTQSLEGIRKPISIKKRTQTLQFVANL